MFTSYYVFEHLTGTNAKTRIDCTASTGDYKPFEEMRTKKEQNFKGDSFKVGGLTLRLCHLPCKYKVDPDRKPNLALVKDRSVSSVKEIRGLMSGVYCPDLNNCNIAFGDMSHTHDALLFVLKDVDFDNGRLKDGAKIEVFVAKGQSRVSRELWSEIRIGNENYRAEMAALRAKAKQEQ